MSIKTLAMYGTFFVGMLLVALFVTGVFQQGILPRFSGGEKSEASRGHEGTSTAQPAVSPENGPSAQAQEKPQLEGSHAVVNSAPPPAAPTPSSDTPPQSQATDASAQVKRLARMYEGMRPKEAAGVLEKLERTLAARVLTEMKERQASKILGTMNPGTAAELSRLLGQTAEKAS
jgi:hypothetical protein